MNEPSVISGGCATSANVINRRVKQMKMKKTAKMVIRSHAFSTESKLFSFEQKEFCFIEMVHNIWLH